MKSGISMYIGLDNTLEENLQLLTDASKIGISRLFTSFHIPETDCDSFQKEAKLLLSHANNLGFDIISDISPNTISILGLGENNNVDLKAIKDLGISTIRLDFGFSNKDIAKYSRNKLNLKIQLNASTTDKELLRSLEKQNADFSNIDALHNFYPRENTGISEKFFKKKTKLFHKYGIKIATFIPSMNRPRSPIKAGLPTLELHRNCSFDYAARQLIAMDADEIFIGDSLPSYEEMHLLAKLPKHTVNLRIKLNTKATYALEILKQRFHTRPDEAAAVLRATESRDIIRHLGISIPPENTINRISGSITIDNEKYGRYMGELQIIKNSLPPDERVNILGYLDEEEQKLLKYLKPNKEFKFLLQN